MTFKLSGECREGRYNPQRLSIARRKKGLTKVELASRAGIDVRSVTSYETRTTEPRRAILDKLAEVLEFPVDFFFSAVPIDVPKEDAVSFRALTKMTAAHRDMALVQGALCIRLNRYFESKFEMPVVQVPDLSHIGKPEAAAEYLRQEWTLGNRPITNLNRLLESKGVRIYSLSVDSPDVDALSTWNENTPFIFLNLHKTAEHGRFDAAHELGHLVLHRHGSPRGKEAERDANAFASAFLMPRASIVAQAPRFATIAQLECLKKNWGVSVAALNYRLHSVGMTSDWHYYNLCVEISKLGLRTREEGGLEREGSQLLQMMLKELTQEGIKRSDIAAELKMYSSTLDEMLFGLVMVGLPGGKQTVTSAGNQNTRLTLV
jgi:Zn-dependent peptidase ImmA (M78 family)